jgi:hypothetical protein
MKRLIAILTLAMVFTALDGAAETIVVSGDVSGTWDVDTVLVTGEIRVPPGETLVIEPGVMVLFEGSYHLLVRENATLAAVGEVQDSIVFIGSSPSINWEGIRFMGASDSCRLAYCVIQDCYYSSSSGEGYGGGIYCLGSNLSINHCRISSCEVWAQGVYAYAYGADIYVEESNSIIKHCRIEHNYADASGYWVSVNAGAGIYIGPNSECLIYNNFFDDNWPGSVDGSPAAFAEIINNYITNNISYGLACSGFQAIIKENIVQNNYSGMYIPSNGALVINNIVIDNIGSTYGGIHIPLGSPTVSGNLVIGNLGMDGGGIGVPVGSPTISKNIIIGNTSGLGGGINVMSQTVAGHGNTIIRNSEYGG